MASGARQVTGFPSPITGPRRRQSRKRAAQPAQTTRAMLAKLLFAAGSLHRLPRRRRWSYLCY